MLRFNITLHYGMTKFNCLITNFSVEIDNIDSWKRKLKIFFSTYQKIPPAYLKMLKRYGANTVDEYVDIIRTNLAKGTIQEVIALYERKKKDDMAENTEKEKKELLKKLEDSKKTITEKIQIRMLTDEDEKAASRLYVLFKQTMGEDETEAMNYTKDFILKNIMFGVFVDNVLVGFVIIKYNRSFKTDISPDEKTDTFYIQELLVDPAYRGQKLGKYLLQYCIYRCPADKQYMSLMTMPTNEVLIKLAKSCGFVEQNVPSGDKNHSLLMIRNKDKIERTVSSSKSPSMCSPTTFTTIPIL